MADFLNHCSTRHKIILSDLESGVTYQYMVGSTDAAGNGATESSIASFTTNPEIDITAPEFTTSPQVIYKNDASATISWETDEEATGVVLPRLQLVSLPRLDRRSL